MCKKFWLIQRGSFNDLNKSTTLLGSYNERLINFDYMGSTEFELGAIPKAYRRILSQFDKYHLHITDIVTSNNVPLCLFCKDENYQEILKSIKQYLDNPYSLKEFSNLEVHFKNTLLSNKYTLRTNFWWCIDNTELGNWIAFTGVADRRNMFLKVLENDYPSYWLNLSDADKQFTINWAFN